MNIQTKYNIGDKLYTPIFSNYSRKREVTSTEIVEVYTSTYIVDAVEIDYVCTIPDCRKLLESELFLTEEECQSECDRINQLDGLNGEMN
jgi:hypothetical protein